MGFCINVIYLSGQIADFTDFETVDFGNGAPVKKTTVLLHYTDTNNGKQYKIPVEILGGEAKMELVKKGLAQGNFMSIDGRLVSSQYMNKNTGKEVTFLKVDPYTIYYPSLGQQIVMKSRFTGNQMTGYQTNPYSKNMTVGDAQQAVQQRIDSMRQNPSQQYQTETPAPKLSPQFTGSTGVQMTPEDDIPF